VYVYQPNICAANSIEEELQHSNW